MDDQDAPISEASITLARGEFVRVIWGKGESEVDGAGDANNNGVREIYIDQQKPTKSADQIVLIHNAKMLDAVVFADWAEAKFPYPEQDDVKALVTKGLWRTRDFAAPSPMVTNGKVFQRNS